MFLAGSCLTYKAEIQTPAMRNEIWYFQKPWMVLYVLPYNWFSHPCLLSLFQNSLRRPGHLPGITDTSTGHCYALLSLPYLLQKMTIVLPIFSFFFWCVCMCVFPISPLHFRYYLFSPQVTGYLDRIVTALEKE